MNNLFANFINLVYNKWLVGDFMVLNNHGWSTKQMILYCSILLIALFFAVFYSQRLMNAVGENFKENVTGKVTYSTVQRNVENAALLYIEKYYGNKIGNGTITVLTENLIDYNVLKENELITSDKDNCKGYALIKKNNKGVLIATPYIQCSDYITENYQSWRLGTFDN